MPLGFSRAKTAPAVPAEPAEGVLQPSQIAGIAASIELIPVALALVGPVDDGVGIAAANGAFRAAGLGATHGQFGADRATRRAVRAVPDERSTSARNFRWEFGSAVDCRHFRVMLARRSAKSSHCFVTLTDHTGELRTERNLRREMMTDSLTGLPNRAAFSERLEERIAAGGDAARYAVLIIDLDRFSRVNACMGSMAGDELLITVARRLKGALRAVDVLARTGGDEFGILLTLEEDAAEADQVAHRIEAALATPFRMSDFEIRVACSIGVAFGSDEIDDAEDLIRHAQFAVKRSKTSGHAEHYQTRAFDAARAAFGIETELRRAIEQGALRLTYQPICDLASGRVVAFESLARWTSESGHEYSPNDFIPVAEESGLIVPLGRWALDEAAKTLRGVGRARRAAVAGSSSRSTCRRSSCTATISRPAVEGALMAHRLAGSRFTLELTESALIADPAARVGHDARAEAARHDAGDGRFRDRLFEPRLSAETADRRAQDRPQLRHRACSPTATRSRSSARSSASRRRWGWIRPRKGSRPTNSRRRWRRSAAHSARAMSTPSRSKPTRPTTS